MSVEMETLAEVLASHADCVVNEGAQSASDTGMDVWSCGIRLPFDNDLDVAGRLHLAAVLAARIVQARAGEGALRERIEAVAAEWEEVAGGYVDPSDGPMAYVRALRRHAARLRAALDPEATT